MERAIQERIQHWLNGPYDSATKEEILRLQKIQPEALVDAFYRDLSFGTGGMRSLMGVGTNRMNIYTVRAATQGLAHYLIQQNNAKRVFIGYDVRLNSRLFAEETARTLAGNHIEVLITKEICPTPLVSFGCRYYQCSAAIVITASHNPPEYNGYKVYWNDGAQVVAPHDEGILQEVKKIESPSQVRLTTLEDSKIQWVGEELDEAYLQELDHLSLYPAKIPLHIVYTNLHGTGLRVVPKALKRRGYSHISLVQEQSALDGHFPAAPFPNPEEEKALALGSDQLLREHADVLIATDPDADRVGLVIAHRNRSVRFNGNEIACLLLSHIATALQERNELPVQAAFVKTIVTTELARKIASQFQIACFDVLTGFKYIAHLIYEWERQGTYQFLLGAEESQGFLYRSFVRDKDAVSAACLCAEMVEHAKKEKKTLLDRLYELYSKHGIYRQKLKSLSFEDTPMNRELMDRMLDNLRQNPPRTIQGIRVQRIDDYLKKTSYDLLTGEKRSLSLEVSDVLHFWLENEGKLIIRLSGTEPKVKIYGELSSKTTGSIEKEIERCDQHLNLLVQQFSQEVQSNAQR